MKRKKPRAGDKVESPYAGEVLNDGTVMPNYGEIKSGSHGRYYVDFGDNDHALEELYIEDMTQVSDGIWEDKMSKKLERM